MKKINAFLFVGLIILSNLGCAPASKKSLFESRVHEDHLCPRNSEWLNAKNVLMKISSEKLQKSASYESMIYENKDLRLVLTDADFTQNNTGEAILIGGQALLTNNILADENHAIDSIDNVALFQQLLFTLIDLAAPEGPIQANFPIQKQISEALYPIQATTQSATGMFNPPWNAEVTLSKNTDGLISFKIAYTFTLEENNSADLKFEGKLSKYRQDEINPALPDNFKITAWKQYQVGPYTKKTQTNTIYDYATTFFYKPFATLGDLRGFINKQARN